MTIWRGPGGTGSASSEVDTTQFQEFLVQSQAAQAAAEAARDAALIAETNAETAETNAETAETNAETAATSATASATSAASSATAAASSATSASSSASSAAASESNASVSASSAATSASSASASASSASTSASNAASSATTAVDSAAAALTQANNAASSASSASTAASTASAAKTAAESARDAALSAYDNFDDRYLGPKTTDPTLDNDGNALLTGALYFNTSSNVMKVYTGSAWVAAYVSAAGVLLAANNLSDVASTATSRTNLNVPTRTGGDASGTWSINITGNSATTTNGVVTTGSYANPAWITSLAGSKVSGNISGNAANVTGTVGIANGGTGQTTRQNAMDALAGSVTSGQYLRGNGTDVVMSAIQVADVPTLNQNTTGTASNVTGIVAVANGGTGVTTSTGSGSVVLSSSPTLTTPNIDSAQFATVTGTAPIYPCRAWVNFNGTGTVAIRASGNVSSITDNALGDFTANFITAMPDANYTAHGTAGTGVSSSCLVTGPNIAAPTATTFRFTTSSGTGTLKDVDYVYLAFFR